MAPLIREVLWFFLLRKNKKNQGATNSPCLTVALDDIFDGGKLA